MRAPEDLWRAADALFDRLLDLAPEQRAAALAAATRDDAELRSLVERLLAAHATDSGVLAPLPAGPAEHALRGRLLGRWRLVEEIGRGGMAVVYRAESDDGTRQAAAVKLLTLAARAAGGDARFAQERELLARLRHPHIATLFDAGIADDGTPWLAMALVEGERIDAWCARRGLAPRAIVRLFLDVCDAVAYAHRNLVIHRDLKPSNVLVDAEGHVRLLDFGIARLADARAEASASQWRALTPEYAAPEQFTGAPPSTQMDVHGLGALLYRLLVGRPPRVGAVAAEAEVTVPSRAAADSATAAQLKGDLDAVLLKALAPDPQQRHDGAQALRQDLQAWLERRPVSARPPAWHYRFGRFVARHRLAALAVGAVLFALVIGLASTLWQAERARLEAERAQREAARAVQQAERATAIKDLVLSLFASADPERAGGGVLDNRQMLQRGAGRLAARVDLPPDVRLEILTTIARAQSALAWYDDASATRAAAHALLRESPKLPALLAAQLWREEGNVHHVRGAHEEALVAYDRAAAALGEERSREADVLRAWLDLGRGNALTSLDRYEEALASFGAGQQRIEALPEPPAELRQALLSGWGAAAYSAGDYTAAIDKLAAAHALQRRPGNEGNASIALTLNLLSAASAMAGRLDDAVRYDAESLALARSAYPADHPQIATAAYAYGDTLRQAGRYAEAMAALDESRAIRSRIGPVDEAVMVDFTRVRVLVAQGRYDDAVALAEAIRPALAKTQGADSPAMLQLANQELAALTQRDPQRRLAGRVRLAEQMLAAASPARRAHPVARFLRWRIARAHFDGGQAEAAERALVLASEVPGDVADHPTNGLVNQGLRLRLQIAAAAPAALVAEMQALRVATETAEGASTEALAYAWLSIAAAARAGRDDATVAAANAALAALDAERPLPAEYAAALRPPAPSARPDG